MTHSIRTAADRMYLERALDLDEPDGGFTVSLNNWDGMPVDTGYAVSIFPECNRQFVGPVDPNHIRAYVLEHDVVLHHGNHCLGGWRDPETGVAHLDIVTVMDEEHDARLLANQHGELAIWDFAAGKSIRV